MFNAASVVAVCLLPRRTCRKTPLCKYPVWGLAAADVSDARKRPSLPSVFRAPSVCQGTSPLAGPGMRAKSNDLATQLACTADPTAHLGVRVP